MPVEVRDNPPESRYEIRTDGRLAGFVTYETHPDHITFIHTEIVPQYEGEGLGGQLARAVLDDARRRGLTVVPICPFIAGYIRRHPDDYLDLVQPALREKVLHGQSGAA
jgi:predicted GNAT family acetyltransferase